MYPQIALRRKDAVLKADNITISQSDFLATHVAMRNLQLLDTFIYEPNTGKEFSEDVLLEKYVSNHENKHQLVVIYGGSGTGKSHLIRWLAAKFERIKTPDEVVLFIRRSDNTLKGTIAQLLEKPEIQEISNRDVYERLTKASVVLNDAKLKDTIYYNFIIQIENDDTIFSELGLSNMNRNRLVAFLKQSEVQQRMLDYDGPIERIYTKVADHVLPNIDVVAEFKAKDFEVDSDLQDSLFYGDAKAKAIANKLEDDDELRTQVACYLNRFVNTVIQTCTGIQPGDFRKVFQDIRKELKKLGKNLTLFIEDITSFTGLDESLLDALIVEHEGMQEQAGMCRISSFIGTTSDYLNRNFRSNHKDRITKYVYIKDNVFDKNQIYEFIARYVNTISLDEEILNDWLKSNANDLDYPIHEMKEGYDWECVEIPFGKTLSLYPFTKNCIDYFCKYELPDGKQTPRYIIRYIIEPVVNDILENKSNFPSNRFKLYVTLPGLSYTLSQQVKDSQERDRILRFLSIWGNGKTEQIMVDGHSYKSGIKESILDTLKMPIVHFGEIKYQDTKAEPSQQQLISKDAEISQVADKKDLVSDDKRKLLAEINSTLTKWQNGEEIDIASTVGTKGHIKRAVEDLCSYLFSSINWIANGVSDDYRDKIKDSSKKLIKLENQKKGEGFFELSSTDSTSIFVLEAFARWRIYGGQSWNYTGADFDLYFVSLWTYGNKDKVVNAVIQDLASQKISYIEVAAASLLIGNILQAAYKEKKSLRFNINDLFWKTEVTSDSNMTSHCNEWNRLVEFVKNKNEATVFETVRKYYNLPMGQGSNVVVLDELPMSKMVNSLVKHNLDFEVDENSIGGVKQVKDIYKYYIELKVRASKVVVTEIQNLTDCVKTIEKYVDIEDIDIDDILDDISSFYKEAENNRFTISNGRSQLEKYVKQNKNKIIQAIKIYQELEEEKFTSIFLKLQYLSVDPVTYVQNFAKLLELVASHANSINSQAILRLEKANKVISCNKTNDYSSTMKRIDSKIQILDAIGGYK